MAIAGCGADDVCGLEKVTDSSGAVTGYECIYPDTDAPTTPLSEYAYIEAKSAPLRFHTSGDGALKDSPTLSDEVTGQEGTEFEYTNNDPLQPNNQASTIGYHEVYGTLGVSGGKGKAPTMITVEVGKTYDLYTESGSFSSCLNCGVDYYSNLAKIFPHSFHNLGKGYTGDPTRTSRLNASGFSAGEFRGDDLVFGRACFIPLTMIPWSHNPASTLQGQRQARLNTQHFLMANGYNRDWYGFNYGSLIGSFDGQTWFSVGTQRQVKATSNKLYLAVNAYFSDLTSNSTYKVFIQETVVGSSQQFVVDSDYESDGASCQKFHDCTSDADCVTQLGWDYSCQNVNDLRSNYPTFDVNGIETLGAEEELALTDILHNYQGGSRKCVYRGRGVPCHQDYASQSTSSSYAKTEAYGLNGCLYNFYCQALESAGTPQAKFNTRLSRYAESPADQNDSSDVTETDQDEFGLAARIIGRPLRYTGTEESGTTALDNFDHNNVEGLCLPGRDPTLASLEAQNSTEPGSDFLGDRVLNLGSTRTGNTANNDYLTACPILDDDGNYVIFDEGITPSTTTPSSYKTLASGQNLSTNLLEIFESFDGVDLLGTYGSSVVEEIIHQSNRCLRAPGAKCFSDLDCGPSEFVRQQILGVDDDNSIINNYEIDFWQEAMVCGQKESKTSSLYDLKENRCCRETGNTLTIGTNVNSNDPTDPLSAANNTLFTSAVPGIDTTNGVDLDDDLRYSQVASVYNDMTNNSFPDLMVPAADECAGGSPCTHTDANTGISNQWKTFSRIAKNSCCTENWVRQFHEDNGNDHHWQSGRMQNFNKENFTCINWFPVGIAGTAYAGISDNSDFTCTSSDPDVCPIRSVPESEAERYEDLFAQLSLMGIPQIMIESDDTGFTDEFGNSVQTPVCPVDPDDGTDNSTNLEVIPGTIIKLNAPNVAEMEDTTNTDTQVYSANDSTNFDSSLKKVFSEDQVACCVPSGEAVDSSVTDDMCCTGNKEIINGVGRCCLEDFTDISLFLNRYVSSLAQDYPDSIFDAQTGFIKNIQVVQQIATELNLCCSGTMAKGTAYSNLKIPGLFTEDAQVKRFIQSNADEDNLNRAADKFDQGQRWSVHLYCVPST